MRRIAAGLSLALFVACLADAVPVAAGANDAFAGYTPTGPNTGQVSVESGRGGEATAGTHRTGRDRWAACEFQSLDDAAVVAAITRVPVEQVPPSPNGWSLVLCTGGDSMSPVETMHIWPRGDALPPSVRDGLVEAAVDSLEVPYLTPQTSPAGTPEHPLVTGLETWLWVDAGQWKAVAAQASIPVATVTATAVPTLITWDPGDGSPRTACDGPGEAWSAGRPANTEAPCGHVYRRTSGSANGGAWPLSVTVTWDVTWSCEPGCGSGSSAPFVLTTTRPVTVHQIQTRLSR